MTDSEYYDYKTMPPHIDWEMMENNGWASMAGYKRIEITNDCKNTPLLVFVYYIHNIDDTRVISSQDNVIMPLLSDRPIRLDPGCSQTYPIFYLDHARVSINFIDQDQKVKFLCSGLLVPNGERRRIQDSG